MGPIKEVEDFKYLGSWIINSKKDISVRTAIAWKALKQLKTVWKSHLSKDFKLYVFNTLIQSILLYSCETWSLTQTLEKKMDGTRNLMVRYALNISWKEHIPNSIIFAGIVPISALIRDRRMKFAGHCLRAKDQPVKDLVLWRGTGKSKGGNVKTYTKILGNDLADKGILERFIRFGEYDMEEIVELALARHF